MNYESIEDYMLHKDVKNVFEKHKNLQDADEIFQYKKFKLNINKLSEPDKAYSDFFEYKKICQLTLNLYNNYEIYQNLQHRCYNNKTSSDSSANYLRVKPNEDAVVKALYDYVLSYLVTKRLNDSKKIDEIPEKIRCEMCNWLLTKDDLNCPVCDETVMFSVEARKLADLAHEKENLEPKTQIRSQTEMEQKPEIVQPDVIMLDPDESTINGQERGKLKLQPSTEDSTKIKEKKQFVEPDMNMGNQLQDESKKIREDPLSSLKDVNHDDTGSEKDEIKVTTAEAESGKAAFHNSVHQWKCRHCEARNENDFVTCIACMKVRPEEWACNRCSLLNDISEEKCAACDNKNENIKKKWCSTRNGEEIVLDTAGEQVKAFIGGICTKVQDGIKSIGDIFDPPFVDLGGEIKQEGEDKEKQGYRNPNTSWVNEYREAKRSSFVSNGNFTTSVSKLCRRCEKNEALYELCMRCLSIRWDCSLIFCGKQNFGGEYCRHCRMEKYPNKKIGATIWQETSSFGRRQVWICDKCDTINDKSYKSCLNCQLQRSMKLIWCTHCGQDNYHSSDNYYPFIKCSKCGWTLFLK